MNPVVPEPCLDGYTCPEKTEHALAFPCYPGTIGLGNGTGLCEPCPAGKYCPNYGMPSTASNEAKFDCSAGYFCDVGSITPFGQKSNSDPEVECSAGFYCPSGAIAQEPCPVGTFRSETRGFSESESCLPCPGGFNCKYFILNISRPLDRIFYQFSHLFS